MIMFFLPWWTYVLIGTVAFTCSFGAVWLAGIAFDRETPDDGPFPCGEHLGTDEDGAEDWCWQIAGHEGDCLGMRQYFDAEETVFTREWPDEDFDLTTFSDEEDVVLPELPQRLSKVPVQGSGYTSAQLLGQTEHNDPWPTCDHGLCELPRAHPGPHSHY